jgi:hypothetical protein
VKSGDVEKLVDEAAKNSGKRAWRKGQFASAAVASSAGTPSLRQSHRGN